jgi:Dolichyl-phosphate-mannose-protein mannosyltransferase
MPERRVARSFGQTQRARRKEGCFGTTSPNRQTPCHSGPRQVKSYSGNDLNAFQATTATPRTRQGGNFGVVLVFQKAWVRTASSPVFLLVLVCVACLGPFLNKAYHIDDTLFLYAAERIQHNPIDFYGFEVNWYGDTTPMSVVMKNPPLASYYLAVAAALFGWSEPALHLAFLFPALGVVWGMYRLAEQLCTRPLIAALAATLTPAFLVSSTNTMCDTLMLCFWVWAVLFWERGVRQQRLPLLFLSATLITCAALTKYIGLALIPLLATYTIAGGRDERNSPARMLSSASVLLVPVFVMSAYEWATQALYGRGLFFQAMDYAAFVRVPLQAACLNAAVSVCFLGGAVAGALFFVPFLWSTRVLLIGLAITAVLLVILALQGASTGRSVVPWASIIQQSVLVATGCALLALPALDWWAHRDARSLLLLLWVWGIFLFATFLNWTINVRTLLPAVPALGILIARRLDQRFGPAVHAWSTRLAWPLIPAGLLAMLVTWADYQMAGSARTAAADIFAHCRDYPGTVWHQGHWGFQYYMRKAGISPLEFTHPKCKPGDLIIIPANNSNVDPDFPPWPKAYPDFYESDLIECRWLASMDSSVGAGFYGAQWGPLPFAFGSVPPSHYRVVKLLPRPE